MAAKPANENGAAVLRPDSEAALTSAVLDSISKHQQLAVKGCGTKEALGRPVEADAVLDLSKLTGVTLYEPAELVIAARAGTPVSAIEKTLAANDQMLAFEPPDYAALYGAKPGRQSIGGVVACNLSGSRRMLNGAARDHLLGTVAVNGLGQVIKGGGRVMKNVTGYDVPRLLCGSYGTLAVMTEVTFKILPRLEMAATIILHGLSETDAMTAMTAGVTSPYEVSGAAYVPAALTTKNPVKAIASSGQSATLLRLENFEAFATGRVEKLKSLMAENSLTAEITVADTKETLGLWRHISNAEALAADTFADHEIWRLSVPPILGAQVLEKLKIELPGTGGFLDWAGGLVWIAAPLRTTDAGQKSRAGDLRKFVGDIVGSRGAKCTLIRGPVWARGEAEVFDRPAPPILALSQRIKESFDPHALLNPGRMHAGL